MGNSIAIVDQPEVTSDDVAKFNERMNQRAAEQTRLEAETIDEHRRSFAKLYMPGMWWSCDKIALLLTANYQELQPSYIDYYYGDFEGLRREVFGRGEPVPFDPELFEHRLWKMTQEVEAALISGELPYEEAIGHARREDAIRWMRRKYGIDVDPELSDVIDNEQNLAGRESRSLTADDNGVHPARRGNSGRDGNRKVDAKLHSPVCNLPEGATWKKLRMKMNERGDGATVWYEENQVWRGMAAEVDMIDRRTTNPNCEWELLNEIASNSGEVPFKPVLRNGTVLRGAQGRVRTRQRLNQKLKVAFGIDDDAIIKTKKRGTWTAAFVIEPHPKF